MALLPTSLACCVQAPPLRVNTHVAPTPPLSADPLMRAVLPSADSATALKPGAPIAPLTTRCPPCWLHTPALLMKMNAPPAPLVSRDAATMTVLASPEIARPPKRRFGLKGPGAVNAACRVHVPPLRVKTTIPVPLSTSAVLPSPDNATGPDATSNCPLVSGATPCWLQPFGPADEHPGRSRAGAVGPPAPEGGVAVA